MLFWGLFLGVHYDFFLEGGLNCIFWQIASVSSNDLVLLNVSVHFLKEVSSLELIQKFLE